jgi:branched-chain amino acid transport system ATP-binding protein
MSLLEVSGLAKWFGAAQVLRDLSFAVEAGEILGVIGPNGSGKTTTFNCISGLLAPGAGAVRLGGVDVTRWRPHALFRLGLGRTFQLLQVFSGMTVRENMLLAAQERRGGMLRRIIHADEPAARRRADALLALLGLAGVAECPARELSYGEQKLVDLGMALMGEPALVLLDEPMAGVNPTMIEKLAEAIRALNRDGVSFAIIEHNVGVVMDLCHRVVVLDEGAIIASGPPARVRDDPRVLAAYFGG